MTRYFFIIAALSLFTAGLIAGCNNAEQPSPQQGVSQPGPSSNAGSRTTETPPVDTPPNTAPPNVTPSGTAPQNAGPQRFEPIARPGGPVVLATRERERNGFKPGNDFTLDQAVAMGALLRKEWPPLPPLDERALRTQGIRVIKGTHLTLCTDLPSSDEIDRLPEIFDRAVPEYCDFFGVDVKHCSDWHMQGFLIDDLEKFRAAGLLGPFPTHLNGFSIDDRLWVREQKTDYFRRHLLLHEGVHGFMNYLFGTCGPVWYMEATAEYLGTHRLPTTPNPQLGAMPQNGQETPGWQRIELLRRDIAAGKGKTVDQVLRYSGRQLETPTDYAWVWALGTLLDNHPRYREAFRDAARWLTFPDFSNRFYLQLADQWPTLQVEWLCFLDELTYGYDVPRMVIDPKSGEVLPASSSRICGVDASRGWQSSGIKLEKGVTYRLSATGRYQLGDDPRPWFSEPNGVTIRYHKGRPIGLLIGAVVPDALFEDDAQAGISPENVPLLTPFVIGPGAEWTPTQSGTLYLRINDSPADLHNNQGTCRVTVGCN